MIRLLLNTFAVLVVLAFAGAPCLAGGVGNTGAFVNAWSRKAQLNCKAMADKPAPPKPWFEVQAPRHTPPDTSPELRGSGAAVAAAVTPVSVSLTPSNEVVGTVKQSVATRAVQVRFSSVVVERRFPLQI